MKKGQKSKSKPKVKQSATSKKSEVPLKQTSTKKTDRKPKSIAAHSDRQMSQAAKEDEASMMDPEFKDVKGEISKDQSAERKLEEEKEDPAHSVSQPGSPASPGDKGEEEAKDAGAEPVKGDPGGESPSQIKESPPHFKSDQPNDAQVEEPKEEAKEEENEALVKEPVPTADSPQPEDPQAAAEAEANAKSQKGSSKQSGKAISQKSGSRRSGLGDAVIEPVKTSEKQAKENDEQQEALEMDPQQEVEPLPVQELPSDPADLSQIQPLRAAATRQPITNDPVLSQEANFRRNSALDPSQLRQEEQKREAPSERQSQKSKQPEPTEDGMKSKRSLSKPVDSKDKPSISEKPPASEKPPTDLKSRKSASRRGSVSSNKGPAKQASIKQSASIKEREPSQKRSSMKSGERPRPPSESRRSSGLPPPSVKSGLPPSKKSTMKSGQPTHKSDEKGSVKNGEAEEAKKSERAPSETKKMASQKTESQKEQPKAPSQGAPSSKVASQKSQKDPSHQSQKDHRSEKAPSHLSQKEPSQKEPSQKAQSHQSQKEPSHDSHQSQQQELSKKASSKQEGSVKNQSRTGSQRAASAKAASLKEEAIDEGGAQNLMRSEEALAEAQEHEVHQETQALANQPEALQEHQEELPVQQESPTQVEGAEPLPHDAEVPQQEEVDEQPVDNPDEAHLEADPEDAREPHGEDAQQEDFQEDENLPPYEQEPEGHHPLNEGLEVQSVEEGQDPEVAPEDHHDEEEEHVADQEHFEGADDAQGGDEEDAYVDQQVEEQQPETFDPEGHEGYAEGAAEDGYEGHEGHEGHEGEEVHDEEHFQPESHEGEEVYEDHTAEEHPQPDQVQDNGSQGIVHGQTPQFDEGSPTKQEQPPTAVEGKPADAGLELMEEDVPDKDDVEMGFVEEAISEHPDEEASSHQVNIQQTKDTQGANLGQMEMKNDHPLSQKNEGGDNHYDNMFEKDNPNFDKYTDVGKQQEEPLYEQTNDVIGFMEDEEEIQPKDSRDIAHEQMQLVHSTWEEVKLQGSEYVGTLLMKNMLGLDPSLLQLFSFKNEPNLYKSQPFITLSKKLISAFNRAIVSCENMTEIGQGLNKLGRRHMEAGVKKEHFNIIGRAFLQTLQMCLKDKFTDAVKTAYIPVLQKLLSYMIGEGYENYNEQEKEEAKQLQQQQQDREEQSQQPTVTRQPQSQHNQFTPTPQDSGDPGETREMNDLENQILEEQKAMREKARKEQETTLHTRLEAENARKAKEDEIHREASSKQQELEQQILSQLEKKKTKEDSKYYIQDLMSASEIEAVKESWKKVKSEDFGVQIFRNLFALNPMTQDLFSFGKARNLQQNKGLHSHGSKVVMVFDKIIENLHQVHKLVPSLEKLGKDHVPLKVEPDHYAAFGAAFIRAIEDKLGLEFTPDLRRSWELMFTIVQSSMLELATEDASIPERGLTIANINTYDYDQAMSSYRQDDSQRNLIAEDYIKQVEGLPSRQKTKGATSMSGMTTDQAKDHYLKMFRKEVDFHHKMAYRFEKAYRLSKKRGEDERKQNLNLDIIECISEHSGYLEQDPMALFYCLYFCIFYKNEELVEFLRILIQKLKPVERIDKLLEYIDVYGINRLRTAGEPMNSLSYHMVFYQAIDDDLRIVYNQILNQLRLIQLRDKDALQLLNNRDYELIELTFNKYVAKVDLRQFYKVVHPMKSKTYRRYNQAFFEEIVINHNVEARVTQNFRERFIQTKEDIYIVFEMYCKEDYDQQFIMTEKSEITHEQFVDLFLICLKNDSFKIAIIIYTLYLKISDMDHRMMEALLSAIRESTKSHELKLFFLHEHFDILTVYQMNQLLDIYDEVLHSKDPKANPMINQYNVIKIALLIYRICWKVEEKQIYSLITKCSVLQAYVNSSLNVYFEKQNNILVLSNYLSEPILHMTERKDSLDIMFEMNMQDLLSHPSVIEVLNLIYEGKYSISSTALSMSPTFMCLLDFDMLGTKRINDKLMDNIVNLGDSGTLKQTSMQYNIWKQCIQQRETDEMFFTVLFNICMVILSIIIILVHNDSQELMRDTFHGTIENKLQNFLNSTPDLMLKYCEGEIDNLLREAKIVLFFSYICYFNTAGMITSVLQKVITFRFRDNVTLAVKQMILEFSIGVVGVIFMIMYSTEDYNTMITDHCSELMEINQADTDTINKIFTMRYPLEGQISFKLVISLIVVQCTIISVLMLQRTMNLGDLIMMMQEMLVEMIKFFITFSLIIIAFLMVGRLLLYELKKDKFYIFTDLFDAINGNQDFDDFTKPVGQVYIAGFMYIFRVLFISLLGAMFINKYKSMFTQMDSFRRFGVIRQKNAVIFDKYIGGVTMTFFPINIFILPFTIPVLSLRNARISDFVLKLQYIAMMLMYISLMLCMIIPMLPLLYIKILVNAIYVSLNSKREEYHNQNLYTLLISIFFGPFISLLSVVIDMISVPSILLKGNSNFEHKYQGSGDRMNDKQTQVVLTTFNKIFRGSKATIYRGKTLTLGQLMDIHGKYFVLIDNLHDLVCRGSKDYRESLKNVQDYNMSKILSTKCSIPDKNGDFKAATCEMDIIYNVQLDVELYNYVDVVLRKYWMGILQEEFRKLSFMKQGGTGAEQGGEGEGMDDINITQKKQEQHDDEDEDQAEDGIEAIKVGPDGYPLFRNPSDLMNNFFINVASIAFTEIQKDLKGNVNSFEIKRLKRYEKEIGNRKDLWRENTVGMFLEQAQKYEQYISKRLKGQKIEEPPKKDPPVKSKGLPQKQFTETTLSEPPGGENSAPAKTRGRLATE